MSESGGYGREKYAGAAYGSSSAAPTSGNLMPSGNLYATKISSTAYYDATNNFVLRGAVAPRVYSTVNLAGAVIPIFITSKNSVAGSLSTSGAVSLKISKNFNRSLKPQKHRTYTAEVVDEFTNIGPDATEAFVVDGLTKYIKSPHDSGTASVRNGLVAFVGASGSLAATKKIVKKLTGGVAPQSSLSSFQYFMYTKSLTSTVSLSGDTQRDLQDPNDLEVLVKRNAQKVIPRVKAYWSNGKFTQNLVGFSSSDIYQEKTKNLNPVLYWKFDEAASSVTTVLDSSVNNHNGKYYGVCAGTTGALEGPDAGKKAYSLNGSAWASIEDISVHHKVSFDDNFQIECLIKTVSAQSGENFIYSKGSGVNNIDKEYGLSLDSTGYLTAYVYAGSNEYKVVSDNNLTLNTWHHIILSVKNKILELIIDGVSHGTQLITGSINDTVGPLEVGRLSSVGSYFTGYIDEFVIYNKIVYSASGSAYARYRSARNTGTNTLDSKFYPEQIMNGFARVSYVWGVTDSRKANGQSITANGEAYAMESENSYRYEHGWWSRSVSNANGVMDFVETVVCEFDAHPANRIDVYTSEFFAGVKEFDIWYKNTNDNWVLLVDNVIINQFEYKDIINLTSAGTINIKGIRLDIKSIWGQNDVARIEEVDPTYVSDISEDIVSFSQQNTRENFDSNVPIGSASASAIDFELNNTELLYSLYNTNSPYANFILPDVKFEVELGWYGKSTAENTSGYNYVPLGTFWADEWQESSDGMTVSVNCRDYSKFLQETVNVGDIWENIDGPDAVSNILKESNFPLFDIKTDLPYDSTAIKNGAAGLWMLNESSNNKYAISWNQEDIINNQVSAGITKQTAHGDIQHGPNNDFTLMFWINTTPYVGEHVIMDFYNNANDYLRIKNPKGLIIETKNGKIYSGVNVADGVWHHVAMSFDKIGTNTKIDIFVDGSLSTTITSNVSATTSRYYLSIGALQTARGVIAQPQAYPNTQFIGLMAYVLLWNGPMTNAQVNACAFREIKSLEENLLFAFTGYDASNNFEKGNNDIVTFSRAYSQDILKLLNVSYVQANFMQFKDTAGLSSATGYGNIDYGTSESAFALEPFNKSAFLRGDRPSSIFFNGSASPVAQLASSYRTAIYGDINVHVQLSMPAVPPSSEQIIYAHSKPSNNTRSLVISITAAGFIKVSYSSNGTSYTNVLSTSTLQSKDLRPNQKFWLRVEQDVDAGASKNQINFFISKENLHPTKITSWESLGEIKTAGTVTRATSAAPITLGADADYNNKFIGHIYAVYVVSGIGIQEARIDVSRDNFLSKFDVSFVDSLENSWQLNNNVFSIDDGSYIYLSENQTLDVLESNFSIAFWAKPIKNENYLIVNKEIWNADTLNTLAIVLTDDGKVVVISKNGTRWDPTQYHNYGAAITSQANVISTSNWNFICVAYDADTKQIKIIVNNKIVGQGIMSVGFAQNTHSWIVGTDGYRTSFAGSGIYLNGLCIFDSALSEDNITSLYRAGASLVNNRFPAVWTEEGESLWDVMLAISTGDLGTFYFDRHNKFIYTNAANNYSPAYTEFTEVQWELDDDIDIISANQSIALQSNKVVVKVQPVSADVNKREALWSAPDNTTIVGGELKTAISSTYTEWIEYKSKVTDTGVTTIKDPLWLQNGYIKIDNEIIYYDRKDDYRLYDLKRGQFDTVPASHNANARMREVRVFNIEYSTKPAIVVGDPFITAKIYDKTVDIEKWTVSAFGAKLVLSLNTTPTDPYIRQKLQSTDPLNNKNYAVSVAGSVFLNTSSTEKEEFESDEYENNIRRYGLKQIDIYNRFIYSHYNAKKYAEYFLKHFAAPVPILEVAVLANPMIELGDRVKIVTFDRMSMSQEEFWVESSQLQYNGGLEQSLTLRKVS